MQTFLVYPSFAHSLHTLDRARAGKQRVENLQILNTLQRNDNTGWSRHPAVKMWRGYEAALGVYMTLSILEWSSRGYANTMVCPYDESWQPNTASGFCDMMCPLSEVRMPPWLGDPALHASHRSNLMRKMPDYYQQYGWVEPHDLEYVWPV